jgi:ABC-type sugar transport system substrate-binding protein
MHMRKRGATACIAAVVAIIGLSACSSSPPGSTGGSGRGSHQYTVGLSMPNSTDAFYTLIASGVASEAKKLGIHLQTSYADNSPATQASQIQSFVARKVNAILSSPSDATALDTAYLAAMRAHIPIFSVANDIGATSDETAFVGADWAKYGKAIAVWTCTHYRGNSGQVAMLLGPAGLSYVAQMADAYTGYLSQSCPKLKVVYKNNLPNETAANALPVTTEALIAHPGIKVIFAENDLMAAGAVKALQEAKRKRASVMVTGFDGDPPGLVNVHKGWQAMTINLDPFGWGALAMSSMAAYLHGHHPASHLISIHTQLLDQSNIAGFCSSTHIC